MFERWGTNICIENDLKFDIIKTKKHRIGAQN